MVEGVLLAAVPEEALKLIAVAGIANVLNPSQGHDFLTRGLAAGAGFATLENLFCLSHVSFSVGIGKELAEPGVAQDTNVTVAWNDESLWLAKSVPHIVPRSILSSMLQLCVSRAAFTVPLHLLCSTISALRLAKGRLKVQSHYDDRSCKNCAWDLAHISMVLLPAIALHASFDIVVDLPILLWGVPTSQAPVLVRGFAVVILVSAVVYLWWAVRCFRSKCEELGVRYFRGHSRHDDGDLTFHTEHDPPELCECLLRVVVCCWPARRNLWQAPMHTQLKSDDLASKDNAGQESL